MWRLVGHEWTETNLGPVVVIGERGVSFSEQDQGLLGHDVGLHVELGQRREVFKLYKLILVPCNILECQMNWTMPLNRVDCLDKICMFKEI